ncbi:hypothetical protein F0365_06185 [Nonlabens sp. Ci31]|uniref:hypothetical protein n=1 Tax=Nonlabens sp. Ci31 TaxID=2608253 RepID=UPI00146396CE|nr:hypothetical protein [Nonlabens sp. Ci31]QJP34022.1 hypothetical protein F0365_06185 [Nonlabens sp. Ci31]
MKNKLLILFIVINLIACSFFDNQSVFFNLKNSSSQPIEEIIITNGVDSLRLDRLDANTDKRVNLKWEKMKVKGSFGLHAIIKEKDTTLHFGYFDALGSI